MPTAHPSSEYLQLRVELEDIEPAIWRRLRIAGNATFWDLHVAIQDAMGWLDGHLHEFSVEASNGNSVRVGSAFEDDGCLRGWDTPVRRYLKVGGELLYVYDFGDCWRHRVVVEERGPRAAEGSLPRCLDGARACPPEDCGGPGAYAELIEAYRDPSHEDHAEARELCPLEFDPDAFAPGAVKFDDPKQRLKFALAGR